MHLDDNGFVPVRRGPPIPGQVLLLFALLLLAACSTPFRAQVSRFQVLPPPAGETFVIEAADPRNVGSIEFQSYALVVQQSLERQGYRLAPDRASAQLIVRMDYGVGPPRERVDTRPGAWSAGWGTGWGRPWGAGWGAWGSWGRWGWYDPWWGWGGPEVYSYTVYPSFLELTIARAADGETLFEGRARSTTRSSDLPFLVPRLAEAIFTGFPGNSGETVNVRIPEARG